MIHNKFKNAKYQPLSRQEMIDLIEGRGSKRVGIACGTWLHIDELSKEKRPILEKLLEDYPEDMQEFYVKKPSIFAGPNETYTWCDVEGADPSIDRTISVGVDEETNISWDIYHQISEHKPDPNEPDMFCFAPENDGRYRLAWFSGGPWTRIWVYRGMTNSLIDLYTNPEDVHHVNRRTINFIKAATKRAVNEVGIDGIGIGDDLGMQKGPFMSPEMFREFYFPYYKELCDFAHELGLHVWLHSCGDVEMLIPQLIEAGFDVLHPIQKYAMDETMIAKKYKDDLTFWAGMDLQRILPFGSVEDVKAETRHFIDTFYQQGKGKMIFTLNNRLQDNVPVENVVAFIEEAYRYGEKVGKEDKYNIERGIV